MDGSAAIQEGRIPMKEDNIRYAHCMAELCDALKFPYEVSVRLKKLAQTMPWQTLAPFLNGMGSPETAPEAMRRAEQVTRPLNPDGFGPLAFLLAASCETRRRYRETGLPDSVFIDSLGCLPRCVREDRANTGRWGFDRGYWVWRQVSGCLFRLGTLEYEYCAANVEVPLAGGTVLPAQTPVLYVHIPSDASLDADSLEKSYRAAGEFFTLHQKAVCKRLGAPRAVLCNSWLLAPALTQLLPPGSGIRRFASGYDLFAADPDDEEFYRWLYGRKMPPEQLPENTSLQRAVKRHLMEGKNVGAAYGILKRRLFV